MIRSSRALCSGLAAVLIAVSGACDTRSRQPERGLERASGDLGHQPTATPWLIGPTAEQDFLRASASEEDLQQRLGAAAVVSDTVHLGEGYFEIGTVVHPNDPGRRLEIVWEDSLSRSHPRLVRVRGDYSEWVVYPGVTLGMTLSAIDSINGKPFSLYGFGWDYWGLVGSYEGGRLDTLWRRSDADGWLVGLRLAPDYATAPDSLVQQVLGERAFSSAHPAMHALNPRVKEITVVPR